MTVSKKKRVRLLWRRSRSSHYLTRKRETERETERDRDHGHDAIFVGEESAADDDDDDAGEYRGEEEEEGRRRRRRRPDARGRASINTRVPEILPGLVFAHAHRAERGTTAEESENGARRMRRDARFG